MAADERDQAMLVCGVGRCERIDNTVISPLPPLEEGDFSQLGPNVKGGENM